MQVTIQRFPASVLFPDQVINDIHIVTPVGHEIFSTVNRVRAESVNCAGVL